jgi:hypothetical protein
MTSGSGFIWTPLRKVLAVAGSVVILAGAATGIFVLVDAPPQPVTCAPGVVQRGPLHECTGVTTGTYPFTQALAPIEKKIANEDAYAAARPHVSIALLMPLTTTQDPTVTAELQHTLDGAYAAQYRANHLSLDETPYIELLLANDGVGDTQWLPVVQQLAGLAGPPYQVLAVTGISTSHATTKAATMWLSQHGVPVVGDEITADDIANSPRSDPFATLARIAPTNTDEAAALGHFDAISPQTTVLVDDRHADDYIDSLAAAFTTSLHGGKYKPADYSSSNNYADESDTAGQFRLMVQNLCETSANLILFAGRHTQLRQFVNELGRRGCTPHSFTILTGDDASHLAADPLLDRTALTSGITVEYAALAYPGSAGAVSGQSQGSWPAAYQDFRQAMGKADLPVDLAELGDGQAIMAHDAVWTAVTAIRNLSAGGQKPTYAAIIHEWPLLYSTNRVDGASGWICLDNHGNPYDKPVPVVAIGATGPPSFVKLVWPAGRPPALPCVPPP